MRKEDKVKQMEWIRIWPSGNWVRDPDWRNRKTTIIYTGTQLRFIQVPKGSTNKEINIMLKVLGYG